MTNLSGPNHCRNIQVVDEDNVDINDGGFILIENFTNVNDEACTFCVETPFLTFVTQGEMRCQIDGQDFHLSKGDCILCLPHFLLTGCEPSVDFRSEALGFSRKALVKNILHSGAEALKMIDYKKEHPAVVLLPEETALFRRYLEMVKVQMGQKNKPFCAEIMNALFLTVFLEICSVLGARVRQTQTRELHGVKRRDWLFKNFLLLLSESGGRERSVAVFADKLHVSSKYLSTVVKNMSGRTALDWILQHAAESVANELKYTDKSIKEIAFSLNFSNLSFFGKFCKKMLGASPKAFRNENRPR